MSVNHARCAFGVVLVVCAAVFANNAIKSVPKTNTNQQQVDEEDTWVPYLDSGLRDDFDWQLLKALNKPNSGNTIFSPISVKILLALLFEGASGLTEQEIQNALQFNGNKSIVRQDFSKVIGALTDNTIEGCDEQQRLTRKHETYTLNLASRIYIDLKHPIMQAYQTKACQKYRTAIEHANFTNAEKTSVIINQYVNHATLGKIPHLVSPSSVEHAELLLVNAIYFRGYWSHQFPMSQSHKGGFYLSPNNVAQVDFMATTDYYYYLESKELSAKLIRIPYKGKKFAMYVILPYAKTGLPALIQRLNVLSLKQLVNIMDKQTVDLILPKFKFEYQTGLREALTSMGMVSMFQNTASLPGITRGTEANLKVTDAIQKAGIEVNEEGSTAFAATDIHLGNKFGDAQSSFNATHPFLFYIEDTESQTILFIGKVTNPLESVTVPLPLPSRFGDIAAVVPQAPPSANSNVQYPVDSRPTYGDYLQTPSPPIAQSDVVEPEPEDPVAKRFNYFDLELLRELSSSENVFISPASIKATLGLILEGAQGQSAVEIAKTLRLPLSQQYVRDQLKHLLYDISDQNYNTLLNSANGVFVSNKLQVSGAFKRIADEFYKATINGLNFANTEQSVRIINTWISNATRGLIPEVVSTDSISPETSIVFTNALYFRGKWKFAFDQTLTNVRCFYTLNGQCQNSYMMQNSAELNYKLIGDIDAHALEIPYSNEEYAMLILVPQMRNNIHALIRDLQHASFNMIVDKLERTEVLYEIPRFEIDYSAPLVSALKGLGIREIFSSKANLSGISIKDKLLVDNIVQKSRIQVNEQGTIAAAATAAIVIPLMGSAAPRVIANHPFIFFIYKRENRNIIFEGIVNSPTVAVETPQQPLPPPPQAQVPLGSRAAYNNVRPGIVANREYRQFYNF